MAERDFITREQLLGITRQMLARAKRAYLELHVEEALDDAERLCDESGARVQPWMRAPLVRRARLRALKLPAKKPGRRRDFFRDDIWFHMVQERRDAGMSEKEAIADVAAWLQDYRGALHANWRAMFKPHDKDLRLWTKRDRAFYHVTEAGLRTAYKRHRRKVRLVNLPGIGRCWVPRRFTYVSGDPAMFAAF